MRDHNICPLRTLVLYCENATMFLNETADNVIAVHCQVYIKMYVHMFVYIYM